MKYLLSKKYSVIIFSFLFIAFTQTLSAQEMQDTTHKHHEMKSGMMNKDSSETHHHMEMKSAPKDSMHNEHEMHKEHKEMKEHMKIDMDMKGMDMKGMDMKGMDMKGMDMKGMDMKGMDMKGMDSHNSIVRKGEIDLSQIDKNKDGKVFQDQMDWNVISDEAGRCPVCEMKLKEVTIDDAKKNLIENGFKIKE